MATDLITSIRDRIVEMMGAMTIAGGYYFDYDPTSINPSNGDLSNAFQAGDEYDDIFPVSYVYIGEELNESAAAFAPNAGIIINDLRFDIFVIPYCTLDTMDEECSKIIQDLKKLFFADPHLSNIINSESDCKVRFTKYLGTERLTEPTNFQNTAGGILFRIECKYGQQTTDVEQSV